MIWIHKSGALLVHFKFRSMFPYTKKEVSMETAIGDKIVETLYLNRVTSENKRIRTLPVPSIQSWGVCCFL